MLNSVFLFIFTCTVDIHVNIGYLSSSLRFSLGIADFLSLYESVKNNMNLKDLL